MTDKINNELDFSRWLADNIGVLNEQVIWDIDPQSVRREESASDGSLRVDLFCEATKPEGGERFNVIIENQLRTTDNDHLARIMEYTAAFDARGVVWIAENHKRIHDRVFRWLNDNAGIDAYLIRLDRTAAPHLEPVVYPGMPKNAEAPPLTVSRSASGWRALARGWFDRVLPKVAARCEHLGVWQTQTVRDLKSPIQNLMWCQQPVVHGDSRVSEYISWYIELHSGFVRLGIYVPGSPRDKSHYYFNSLSERKAKMDRAFGEPLETRIYRGGFKHIVWEPHEGVGYECADEVSLQYEAAGPLQSLRKG